MKKLKIFLVIITLSISFSLFTDSKINLAGIDGKNEFIYCGNVRVPAPIAPVLRTSVLLLQIIVPLGLIIIGSLDFAKAVTAFDEKDIKKHQAKFFKRLISGGLVFFVIVDRKSVV